MSKRKLYKTPEKWYKMMKDSDPPPERPPRAAEMRKAEKMKKKASKLPPRHPNKKKRSNTVSTDFDRKKRSKDDSKLKSKTKSKKKVNRRKSLFNIPLFGVGGHKSSSSSGKKKSTKKLKGLPKGAKYLANHKMHLSNGFYVGEAVAIPENGNQLKLTIKIHGKGTYVFNNGAKYEGNFNMGIREGTGTMIFANDHIYKGEFKKNTPHGFGQYMFTDGSSFVGKFIMGKKNGKGKLTWPNGNTRYDGDWKDDRKHGIGIYYFKNKSVYIGEFKHDKKEGLGCLKFADGSDFVGFFRDNEKWKDFIMLMLEEIGLRQYMKNFTNNNFHISMLKDWDNDDMDAFLEIVCNKKKAHMGRIKKYLVENMDLIKQLTRYL